MLRCREPDEVRPPNPNKLRRCFININCSKCGQEGHNATTCERKKQGKSAQVNGEGDPRGQTSANPGQQQLQTNGGNRTSETEQQIKHTLYQEEYNLQEIYMSESNTQVSNPSSSSTRASTMKTNT
ncbi:PREDICTED: uncharacterized protein [Prunus dulcis]|uniref:PREDICTED: uncharacterized protein n=1 Tax=Prunus dulcis TaxID=3755 RepID=A0A5E4GKT2_PRUDU|nr:uncharacterized protein LOC117613126 [Prunus dulcis]VVA40487.1 PREDICTED: uncharacterized protein [Prunus dulcis]